MKKLLTTILCLAILATATSCGAGTAKTDGIQESDTAKTEAVQESVTSDDLSVSEQDISEAIPEDGIYDSRDEVALYLYTYGRLPDNYITKKEAKALGWEGGGLEDYAPGKCIGGDYFGNYEGLLPEEDDYSECDIDTLGKSSRGAKRIIFSDDGDIYYTDDHYESFSKAEFDADGNVDFTEDW